MTFDKNQQTFPSSFCRDVWWWAIGIVPPETSLTDEVKSKCSPDVLEGCYDWHDYFNELCADMYSHEDAYVPAPARQYRDILEHISCGEVMGDSIVWRADDWERYKEKTDKSKAYREKGLSLEFCLNALARTGLRVEYDTKNVIFTHKKYPKIFHAMHTMEQSPGIRETHARHHFAHCEFRQLFKNYSANYDELLRKVSDESLQIARSVHEYCKTLKIQRYIHYDIIKYKYNGLRVLDFSLRWDEYPALQINIGTCANPGADINGDGFYKALRGQSSEIQRTFVKNLDECDNPAHNHQPIEINGREEFVCPYAKIKIRPKADDLAAVLAFISARKASIDQM